MVVSLFFFSSKSLRGEHSTVGGGDLWASGASPLTCAHYHPSLWAEGKTRWRGGAEEKNGGRRQGIDCHQSIGTWPAQPSAEETRPHPVQPLPQALL